MKITQCKYGHYYDKAYFAECPHCYRKNGGRDEDIIIKNTEGIVDLSGKNRLSKEAKTENQVPNYRKKEQDRANVERWIGEAWDELEEILSEDYNKEEEKQRDYSIDSGEEDNRKKSDIKRKVRKENKKEDKKEDKKSGMSNDKSKQKAEKEHIREEARVEKEVGDILKKETGKECEMDYKGQKSYMLFAAMPLKVIKNQEFCMDFCLFPEKEWETGAKMLHFKSQESIRDLKPVQMNLPVNAILRVLYKEEEIFKKELTIGRENKKEFHTFPVTVTDTRDRRFHMIKVVFEVKEQNIEVPLYLMPNP